VVGAKNGRNTFTPRSTSSVMAPNSTMCGAMRAPQHS